MIGVCVGVGEDAEVGGSRGRAIDTQIGVKVGTDVDVVGSTAGVVLGGVDAGIGVDREITKGNRGIDDSISTSSRFIPAGGLEPTRV